MKLSRRLVPDLAVLQAFECAARHGNFTRAAAELQLTQSAVSRQIRALEAQLGVALFERVRQRVVLSDAGRSLLPEVSRLLGQTEEVVLRALAASDGKTVLSIATLPTFGSRWLARRLPDFLRRHPGTVLNIASRGAPFDLAAEDFDLAIHYGQPVWARASCSYLCSEVIVPVASPALLAATDIAQPGDLRRGPLLHLDTRPKLWTEWFQAHAGEGLGAYAGNRFDQFGMIIAAALAGLGFALLPDYLIEQELAEGALRIVFDRPMTTDNSYYVVQPEGRQQRAAAQAFREWLATQVSPRRPVPGAAP
ncbi:LysR family transcriptional regulator [Xanthobacter sp. ZOL 2024]